MTWSKARFGLFRYDSAYDRVAPTFPRLVGQRFPFPGGPRPREPGSPPALLALHAQQPRRRLTALHKLFRVALRTCWSGWTKPLILVTPRTVVNWHRAGFRLYWMWVSRVSQVRGRKRASKEVRALIFRMVSENPTRGAAPRIHGELLKLGFELSERSVSRWIRRAPGDPDSVKR
jgi:putative transposase